MGEFKVEVARIDEMYQLVTSGNMPKLSGRYAVEEFAASVIFGRKSAELADAAVDAADRSRFIIPTGNIGVDSGDLWKRGTPEAVWLSHQITTRASLGANRMGTRLFPETRARSGAENAQYSVRILSCLGNFGSEMVVGVSHPAASLRLSSLLRLEAERQGMPIGQLAHYGSKFHFDVANPRHQYEVVREIRRVRSIGGINPRPSDEMNEYANAAANYLRRVFKSKGIRNPSTADDTDPKIHPLKIMLEAPQRNTAVRPVLNGAAIVRAAGRETRIRLWGAA